MKVKCTYAALHGDHLQVQLSAEEGLPGGVAVLRVSPEENFFIPEKWYELTLRLLGDKADILDLPPVAPRPSNVVDIKSAAPGA